MSCSVKKSSQPTPFLQIPDQVWLGRDQIYCSSNSFRPWGSGESQTTLSAKHVSFSSWSLSEDWQLPGRSWELDPFQKQQPDVLWAGLHNWAGTRFSRVSQGQDPPRVWNAAWAQRRLTNGECFEISPPPSLWVEQTAPPPTSVGSSPALGCH